MISRAVSAISFALLLLTARANTAPAAPAAEYQEHLRALGQLTIAVAQAMPVQEYDFKPDPPSMSFGEQFVHIASTNYAYCAGLMDVAPPSNPSPTDKDGIIQFLRASFDYCSAVISRLTAEQLDERHNSPDGRLLGKEILLVFFVHVAHHRGQAEVYLRDKGIKPPQFIF